MSKASAAEGAKLGARFDEVRQRLLQSHFADRLGRPLEYWVLPSDRRLPLALLNRTLNDLLATPFNELSATPGIGQKKISSLVKLLDRATRDEPPVMSVGWDGERRDAATEGRRSAPNPAVFDPSIVSEALWAEWRATVAKAGVSHESLGRVAPSLQRLPTVIWETPLSFYLDHSVAEIRQLRTHGEKRVRCVLEVFHSVYYRLSKCEDKNARAGIQASSSDGSAPSDDGESTRREALRQLLTPIQLLSLEHWLQDRLSSSELPSAEEVYQGFVVPLMNLIETDCGDTVASLVSDRLGLQGGARSVREQASNLGVTRARIYQLLDDCGRTMSVRWGHGSELLDQVTSHFSSLPGDHQQLRLFFGLRELCFPAKQRGLDDELDQLMDEESGDARQSPGPSTMSPQQSESTEGHFVPLAPVEHHDVPSSESGI
ncbi:MAG: hypothetical protein KDA92_12220, partial [Planctomycetales bacterium]|nr:hypothetical protein [Planctomycetales bacterium]